MLFKNMSENQCKVRDKFTEKEYICALNKKKQKLQIINKIKNL